MDDINNDQSYKTSGKVELSDILYHKYENGAKHQSLVMNSDRPLLSSKIIEEPKNESHIQDDIEPEERTEPKKVSADISVQAGDPAIKMVRFSLEKCSSSNNSQIYRQLQSTSYGTVSFVNLN